MRHENDNQIEGGVSKTKLKQHMEVLQDLGLALVKLSKEQLAKFDLSDTLLEAIKFAKIINSNSALRRHYQYIGKLMRSADENYIRERLSLVTGESRELVRIQHECEAWRAKLLESDNTLNLFILKYPSSDITDLRQLIRSVRKELELGQNRNYRKLFQFIREHVQS